MLEENNNLEFNEEEQKQEENPVFVENTYSYINEEYIKKRDIRKVASIVGIPALCIWAIGNLWSYLYIYITTGVVGMSFNDAVKLSENPAIQQILQIILSCLMFLLPFSIAAKCAGVRIDKTILFEKEKKSTFLPFILFGIGFCSFSNIAISYAERIFEIFGVDYDVDFGENPTGIFGFLLTFIATAIVPALVEEFACRGIVLGLLKKHGEGFAIIASAVIFGIMHGNFEQIPFAVFVGLILGYIYVKTKNIWSCVIVHGVNNAISVIFNYLQNVMTVDMQNVLYISYLIASLLAAVVGVLLLAKNNDVYTINKHEDIITEKEKYKCFFTSWAIIVFIILNFIDAMKYFDFTSLFYSIMESAGV